MEYNHIPVLYDEVIEGLNIKGNGIYFDGTLGGGGHSEGILKNLTSGKLIATDKDNDAIENAKVKLEKYKNNLILIKDDFKNIMPYFDDIGVEKLDGVLLDLGVSSYQIDTAERGFSYMKDAPLDMRMNREQKLSAFDVINTYSIEQLTRLLFDYGEENFARNIANNIDRERKKRKINTTFELVDIIEKSYPAKLRYKNGSPAKKTFQAIRIEVNNELLGLKEFVNDITLKLKKGGRICIITFHSLEDRIVKQVFRYLELDCICDKRLPVCNCNKRQDIKILTKKPILGSGEEEKNKRSKSAKLRIVERI